MVIWKNGFGEVTIHKRPSMVIWKNGFGEVTFITNQKIFRIKFITFYNL